jgi:uncharacterized delta-60 repeat protein
MLLGCLLALAVSSAPVRAAEPLDPSFGEDGVFLEPSLKDGVVGALTQDGQGRIVAAGATSVSSVAVLRVLPEGFLDPSFNGGNPASPGQVKTAFSSFSLEAHEVLLQLDGKIVVFGTDSEGDSLSSFAIARYKEDGTRDPSFDEDGRVRTPVSWLGGGGALAGAITPSGRLLAAGYKAYFEGPAPIGLLIAYRPNGSIDTRFGKQGYLEINAPNRQSVALVGVEVFPGGKILVGGEWGGRFMLMRLLPNGKPDPSFSKDGRVLTDIDKSKSCPCAYTTALEIAPGGKILLVGKVTGPKTSPAVIARYLPHGRLDPSFGKGGIVRTTLGRDLKLRDAVVQPDGKITATGLYRVRGTGETQVAVVRYLPNGSLNRSFAGSGFFTRDFGVESLTNAALVQSDGSVVVGGRANPEPSKLPELNNALIGAKYLLMRFLPG